ncbi:hypothetical protein H2O64_21015 [Kordia sp. YSTF-M3]|uniref:Bacteriocin n=1 Tax=Kordia aestuariivivens TaxID=2759037 RepID=A0ABR7QF54_9FLAO|nr:hypothetical protein [Kordia aestuariivivens]MBC8757164.1 hypothetical protein [Kordia aestuariivivens]
MLDKIANLGRVLSKEEMKNINGGVWVCYRRKGDQIERFDGNQSEGTASAWVNAWGSLGWNASCRETLIAAEDASITDAN